MIVQFLAAAGLFYAAFCRIAHMTHVTHAWPVRWLVSLIAVSAAAIGISPWVWNIAPSPWVSALLVAQCLLMVQPRRHGPAHGS